MCHAYAQVGQCRDGPIFDKATLLTRVQMQLAELEREMASTKAEVLGSCVTSCNWVSSIFLMLGFCMLLSLEVACRVCTHQRQLR